MTHLVRKKTVRALVAAGLAMPALANAQTVSDLMPAGPAPSTGAASATGAGQPQTGFNWMPGMPAPSVQVSPGTKTAAARTAATEDGKQAGADLGRYVLDGNESDVGAAALDDGPMPETHLVQRGDTLWDIASVYHRNPWAWPKLWALNPLITNPHWIYPGDVVRLRNPNEGHDGEPASASSAALPGIQISRVQGGNFTLRQNGFVEQADLQAAAKIVGSREEKIMLAMLDEAYVEFSKDQPLHPGERYSVYRVVEDVKTTGGRGIVGSIVEVVGEVEVRSVTSGRIARAVIVDATNPIERGFRVGPLRRQFKLVDPVVAQSDVDAIVVATLRPEELVGEATIVFVDRGRDDGLQVGNRFVMVRRGDGYRTLFKRDEKDDARFPREVLGEVLVVDVRNKTATGVVARALKEVRVGERLEARKGF